MEVSLRKLNREEFLDAENDVAEVSISTGDQKLVLYIIEDKNGIIETTSLMDNTRGDINPKKLFVSCEE